MIRRVTSAFLLLFLITASANATHNRAGEITYTQISDLTYEVTVTTFTYTLSKADRPTLDVEWGDNSITNVARISETYLPNNYKKNVYVSRHTYPGTWHIQNSRAGSKQELRGGKYSEFC